MTVFQQDKGDSPVLKAASSLKKRDKYFAAPRMLRKSEAIESFSFSIPEHAPDVVPSRKKSLTHAFASTEAMTVSGVTFREKRRPITRSYKNNFPCTDLAESSDENYSDFYSSGNVCATSGGNEHHTTTTSTETTCWAQHTSADESSTKCNLNETFEIKNETIKSDNRFSLEASQQDFQPDKLYNSTRKKRITVSPLRMQGHSRTSTPKDDTDDKENEISDSESMSTTFEIPCPSKDKFCSSNIENIKSGRRKRSFSCPQERIDEEGHSKAVFFSPVGKLVAPSESQLHPKRGTPLKGTKIPTFVKKMPDFTNIHKKVFEKMESVVDCHQRKLERAKMLFSPKAVKDVQPVMVFSAQSSTAKQMLSRNPMTQRNELPANQVIRNIPQKAAAERNIFQHPQPHKGRVIQHNDIKRMVANKLPLQKSRGVREESRTVIRGVRLNRRFELQMAHRKLN
ncbi:hypothetical protein B7P43_G14274 [Cryptotermes secundus]|uniref:Uncharacterized protein n=2 Tax=Cryptotermes secundus TaxID=105785 RepID=A0A2J7RPB2_9NEOP|nr:hypothetical protein B7P43_G14274 [Cryptotermes secundus]